MKKRQIAKNVISVLIVLCCSIFVCTAKIKATSAHALSLVNSYNPLLVDEYGLYSNYEFQNVEAALQNATNHCGFEVIALISNAGTSDANAQAFQDDYYDSHGYGSGPNNSGIILVIDMNSRMWTEPGTCGDCITIFTDYGLEYIFNLVGNYLYDGDFDGAVIAYANACVKLYDYYVQNGYPYDNYQQPEPERESRLTDGIGLSTAGAAAVSGIGVGAAKSRSSNVKKRSSGSAYLDRTASRVNRTSDQYLTSHTSRVRIVSEDNRGGYGGGGSSVHISSGGISHGGGGHTGHF